MAGASGATPATPFPLRRAGGGWRHGHGGGPVTSRSTSGAKRRAQSQSGDQTMKKIAAVVAVSASALAMSASVSFADYTLTILHINDWHSRIESNNKFESTCSAEDEGKGECIGGA